MVNFTVDEIRGLMDNPANVRNVSVIGHVDHGKSTLSNALIAAAGVSSAENAGHHHTMHLRTDEHERGTTKSNSISLRTRLKAGKDLRDVRLESNGNDFLFNLIDSPGHVDFSSEVTAALRVTDGALVVVDCVEGVSAQTNMVLQQALSERVKPVVIINKVDCALLDLQIDKEELFQSFSKTIESINATISTHHDKAFGDVQVNSVKGTVAFGSGLHGWAFTVRQFAAKYATQFGVDEQKMTEHLWGESYFNPYTKKWTRNGMHEGNSLERAFNQFCLTPIFQIYEKVNQTNKEDFQSLLNKLDLKINREESCLEGEQLLQVVMRKFLPCAEALLEMIVLDLPSPATAQRYRADILYDGPMDDENAVAIRNCDPDGPLMLYVSKMVPEIGKHRFYAFGRVFAGTVRSGLKVRIQGPKYSPGKKDDLFIQAIQRTVLIMGDKVETLDDCPAGSLVGLGGIDQFLLKSGTLTTNETAHNLKVMKFSVSPVVQRYVEVKNAGDLPKLIDGLKHLSKSDPCVVTTINESGEHVVAGAGELHLEVRLKDLAEDYAGVPLRISDPTVQYRESVGGRSSMTALSKSPNRFNRLWVRAEPLTGALSKEIDSGKVSPKDDRKTRARVLTNQFGWDVNDARKIWCFGPDADGPNLLIDQTKAVIYLHEIKDSFISGFQWATSEGPMGEEPMRGIRFNIIDVGLFSDTIHRGSGQIIPTARRVLYASTLLAEPTLLEPIFLVEIKATEQVISGVHDVLARRRGTIFAQEQRFGTSLDFKAHLPVKESFGFNTDLRQATAGRASSQAVFDHWSIVPGGSPLDATTTPGRIATELRKKKGIKETVPLYTEYCDKL